MRAFGHPLHPLTVHLPIGLWLVAAGADLCGACLPSAPTLARACLLLGLLASVPALLTGLADYAGLPADSAAEATARRHVALVLAAAGLFAVSLVLRLGAGDGTAPAAARVLSLLAAGVLALGAHQGGELVFGHGVGVGGGRGGGRRAPRSFDASDVGGL